METVKVDYAPKGDDFYYIYKPLAHPEYNNYVVPVNLEERLMHVEEAKRVLGSSITWLADTMDNPWYEVMARTPNSRAKATSPRKCRPPPVASHTSVDSRHTLDASVLNHDSPETQRRTGRTGGARPACESSTNRYNSRHDDR